MASKKKVTGGKRPQNLRRTLGQFSAYLGRHRIMIGLVALLAAISALAALFGTYMIRPVVNGLLENGSKAYLAGAVGLTACIYIIGALSTLGYTQLMVRAAQKILQDIRRDLNEGLDDHRKAVVQRVRDRVHVVREQAHQIAFAVRVKVVQPRLLCAPAGQPR